ncbi:hypothetical protein INT46_002877 [Mucor plumbeus]|uniref:Uncharacterized protein n=1 Tax=Mucor plumbeus TaxID=97098 RepID=A0A8H7QBQ7_9FUNG|nr:hypothetical protein INT46_002877 [Mucor plumbeus]
MNNPGDSMDEFGDPIVGSLGLINYKDNNESTYKVIWPFAVFGEKHVKRTPRKLYFGFISVVV